MLITRRASIRASFILRNGKAPVILEMSFLLGPVDTKIYMANKEDRKLKSKEVTYFKLNSN